MLIRRLTLSTGNITTKGHMLVDQSHTVKVPQTQFTYKGLQKNLLLIQYVGHDPVTHANA